MIGENFKNVLKESEQIRAIVNQYCDYLMKNKKWKFENDIRFIFINQLNNILISHNLNISYIIENISNIDWVKQKLQTDNYGAFEIHESYITYNRNALIFSLTGVVERFFRRILMELNTSSIITEEFYNIRKNVFELLEIDKEGDEWKALNVLSNIRNTIHNNGIHLTNRKDMKEIQFKYHHLYIIFKNEKQHFNAKYEILNFVLMDLINLARIINEHPKISNINCIEEDVTLI